MMRAFLVPAVAAALVAPAGRHDCAWDGRDDGDRPVPAGAYLPVLATPEGWRGAKLLLLR